MNLPGFTAEASLGPRTNTYFTTVVPSGALLYRRREVMPQFRLQQGPDLGAYLRCKANGGGELICRFFGGLPPFTIGTVLLGA
jgi:hypothetical protein